MPFTVHSGFTDKQYILHKWINMEDQDNNGNAKLYIYDFLNNSQNSNTLYAMKNSSLSTGFLLFLWSDTQHIYFSTLIATCVLSRNGHENASANRKGKILQRKRFRFTQISLTQYNMHVWEHSNNAIWLTLNRRENRQINNAREVSSLTLEGYTVVF